MSVPTIEPNRIINERNPATAPPRKFHIRLLPPVEAAPPAPVQVDLQAVRDRAAKPRNLRLPSSKKSVTELQEETAKFIFNKNKTFKTGFALANEWVKNERFNEAFEVFTHLYDLPLESRQKEQLFKSLNTLTEKGHQTIGQPFYAWIRCALTRELEENSPNPTNEQIEQIINGYSEAANLGSHFARYNLAIFYDIKLSRPDEARTNLIKYTEEHPQRSFGYKELANFYLMHPPVQVDAAIEALRRGLSIDERDPTSLSVPAELALMLAELLGKQDEAIQLYTKAKDDVKADSLTRSKAAFNLGALFQTKNEHALALACFRESKQHAAPLEDSEYNASVDIAIAETLLQDEASLTQEQHNEALRLIESAKKEANLDAELLYAKLLAKGNQFAAQDVQQAITAFSSLEKRALENDPYIAFQSHLHIGRLAEPAMATKSLLTANRLLVDNSWDDRQSYLEQVDTAIKSTFDAIIEENRALKEQLEVNLAKSLKLEQELAQLKNKICNAPPAVAQSWQKDIETQATVLAKNPQDDEALFHLAFAHLQKGEYKEAFAKSMEYLKRGHNKDWRPWSVIARCCYNQGHHEQALKYVGASLDLNSSEETTKALKGQIEQALAKKFMPAQAPATAAVKESAQKSEAPKEIYEHAKKLFNKNEPKKALDKFKQIYVGDLLPEIKDKIRHYIATCYSRLGRFVEALHFVNEAISLNKKCPDHYRLRVKILIHKKDFAAARSYIAEMEKYGDKVDDLKMRLPPNE